MWRMRSLKLCVAIVPLVVFGCRRSPEDVVRKYLNASAWRDRLPVVLNPDDVTSKMAAHYGDDFKGPRKFRSMTSTCTGQRNECSVVVTRDDGNDGTSTTTYTLWRTPSGWKIDWEASVGYNATTPAAFLAQRPTTPVRFRVWAELSDYYNYAFMNGQKQWYSVALSDDGDKELPTGYIAKNSDSGQRVFDLLKDGRKHRMVVDIAFPSDSIEGNVVNLDAVSFDTWRIAGSSKPNSAPNPVANSVQANTATATETFELPPDGQVLRDTWREVQRLARMGCNVRIKEPRVVSKLIDQYERDECNAIVNTRCGDFSFNVVAVYQRHGSFWKLKGLGN